MIPRCSSGILLEDWEACPDAAYCQVLQQFLDREDKKTERHETKERFAIHRACMSRLIERLPGYQPLLTAIQAEYENFVETLERGENEAFFLESKLENLKGEKGTLGGWGSWVRVAAENAILVWLPGNGNYANRIHDLQQKISVIKSDNARLEEEIREIKGKWEKAEAERLKIALESGEIRSEMTATQRCLLLRHLTLEHSTDLNRLKYELAVLESSVQEMQANHKKQFLPKTQKIQLEQHLKTRQVVHDRLSETNDRLQVRLRNLRIALEATIAYRDRATEVESLADVVDMAIAGQNYRRSQMRDHTPSEDDDPAKEKETQMMLEYIEKFNELMAEQKYEEAVVHAANSPKGVLRTSETLSQFKAASPNEDKLSPLLLYCQTLLATRGPHSVKPNKADSVECTQCALQHDKLDLLAHWLATDSLTCSVPLGELIEGHARDVRSTQQRLCFSLAQTVYTRCEAYRKAAVCMCRHGRYYGMIRYAQEVANFNEEDYQFLLETEPNCELASHLVFSHPPVFSVDKVVTALQTNESCLISFYKDLACHSDLENLVSIDCGTSQERWKEIIQQCVKLGLQSQADAILAATAITSTLSNKQKENLTDEQ